MNILFVCPDFTPSNGGVQRVTDILAKGFIERGHKVNFLSLDDKFANENTLAPVLTINVVSTNKCDLVPEYQKLLQERKIDFVINQLPQNKDYDFCLKYILSGIKTISVYHSKPFGWYRLWKNEILISNSIFDRFNRILHCIKITFTTYFRFVVTTRLSDNLILLSDHYKKSLLKIIPCLPAAKINSIANPIGGVQPLEMSSRKKQILFVGRVSDRCKNIYAALSVWEKFVEKHKDWNFIVVGDDSNIDDIKSNVKERAIPNIKFVGHTYDVTSYYAESEFIIVSSFYEGWPMVICEAMSYGCIPSVFNTFQAVNDLIQDGESGLICTPFNSSEMVERLEEVLADPVRMQTMAENAANYIQRFNVEMIVDQWEELFNQLKN